MKRIFLLPFLLLALVAEAQFPAHPDSIYTFIKYNSIFRKNITDWKPVDSVFKAQVKAAKTDIDTIKSFIPVLEQLNDVHSYFVYNGKYYNHYNPVDSFTLYKLQPLLTRAKTESGHIYTQMLRNGIVYIQLPAMNVYGTDAINQAAQALHDSVYKYQGQRPKGFIIDLRLNSGGNMYPMLAGLSPILGNGLIGFETDADDRLARKWEIKNGDLYMGDVQQTFLKQPVKTLFSKLPVGILTSSITSSSGAMVAIAFRGRTNTASFGENTADGYTTSNGYFSYAPNLAFNFATTFVSDRTGKKYMDFVMADIPVLKENNFDNPAADESVLTASKWILNR